MLLTLFFVFVAHMDHTLQKKEAWQYGLRRAWSVLIGKHDVAIKERQIMVGGAVMKMLTVMHELLAIQCFNCCNGGTGGLKFALPRKLRERYLRILLPS